MAARGPQIREQAALSRNLKLILAMIVVAVLVLGSFALFSRQSPQPAAAPELVRADSPRLSDGTKATFVEFLDFECESCASLHPVIEHLRGRYGDRITFVVRHMPLHGNSMDAARAAEAAGAQGRFEAMYKKLFETQGEWGHQQTSQRDVFFGYAKAMGLDMDKFTAAFADPATTRRIEQSAQDGRTLGVQKTPTMFLNGTMIEPESFDDFVAKLDAAVA